MLSTRDETARYQSIGEIKSKQTKIYKEDKLNYIGHALVTVE